MQDTQCRIPNAGCAYARDRNVDRGSGDRSNVSALSPWIRRRLITGEEVIPAVLRRHAFSAAEKFIQEVLWHTYWKGWLELRPGVLSRFNTERLRLKQPLMQNANQPSAFARATPTCLCAAARPRRCCMVAIKPTRSPLFTPTRKRVFCGPMRATRLYGAGQRGGGQSLHRTSQIRRLAGSAQSQRMGGAVGKDNAQPGDCGAGHSAQTRQPQIRTCAHRALQVKTKTVASNKV